MVAVAETLLDGDAVRDALADEDPVIDAVIVGERVCVAVPVGDRVMVDVGVGEGGNVSRAINDTPENSIFRSVFHLINICCPLLVTDCNPPCIPDNAKIFSADSSTPS